MCACQNFKLSLTTSECLQKTQTAYSALNIFIPKFYAVTKFRAQQVKRVALRRDCALRRKAQRLDWPGLVVRANAGKRGHTARAP